MKYEKAVAAIVEFDNSDVVTASGDPQAALVAQLVALGKCTGQSGQCSDSLSKTEIEAVVGDNACGCAWGVGVGIVTTRF